MSLIFGIFLFIWRKDPTKTKTINSIDKFVNSIFNNFVLLKNKFCHKKEANVTAEPEKEISKIEEGKAILTKMKEINERKKTIDNLKKFVSNNISNEDTKIKKEVEEAKKLLALIKNEVQILIAYI